jgi:ribosomal protein S18 acetylase RimI-like enzyme
LDYRRDCTPDDAGAIARLFFEGFREVPPAFGTPHSLARIIRASFSEPDVCIVARDGGELKGFAMLDFEGHHLFKMGLRHFLKEYGPAEGLRRAFLGALLNAGSHKGAFLLDVLAVDASCRGQGVGSRLLEETETEARRHGYASVTLDVVDENPRAKKLYESVGYERVKHRRLPFYRRLFGISGYTRMVKRLV